MSYPHPYTLNEAIRSDSLSNHYHVNALQRAMAVCIVWTCKRHQWCSSLVIFAVFVHKQVVQTFLYKVWHNLRIDLSDQTSCVSLWQTLVLRNCEWSPDIWAKALYVHKTCISGKINGLLTKLEFLGIKYSILFLNFP